MLEKIRKKFMFIQALRPSNLKLADPKFLGRKLPEALIIQF